MRRGEVEAQQTAMTEMVQGWAKETMSDPELGGQKWAETETAAKRFLSAYGNDGVTKMLDDYGLGNNPAFIRMLAKAGKAMGSDSFLTGSASAGAEESDQAKASRMFPKTLGNMKK
jgi:hypothetical protein